MQNNKEVIEKNEKNEKNPFEALHEIYREGVEKGNQKNNPQIYKECMKYFKYQIEHNDFYVHKKKKTVQMHLTDIKYTDGYFIFGTGDNSIVSFKIKEIPGWLFGIWWNDIEKDRPVKGEWFAQYEANIDKFKPSASSFRHTIQIDLSAPAKYTGLEGDVEKSLTFLYAEPMMALGRYLFFFDYNFEYYSRRYVTRKVKKSQRNEKKYQHRKQRMIKTFLRKMHNLCKDEFANREFLIRDCGEYCSPRFEIYVPESHFGLEPGVYEDIFSEEGHKRFLKIINKPHHKISEWLVDEEFCVVSDQDYKKIKKRIEKGLDK